MLRKIKGLLGFCQVKGCWKRSVYEVKIKEINRKTLICKDCANKLLHDKSTRVTGVTMNVDIDL